MLEVTHGRRAALGVLIVLTAINFVNYLDRYVLAALVEPIASEFGLSDGLAGLLQTSFMVVYMIAAPFVGYYGDRTSRRKIIAATTALWSLATIASGFADSYEALMLCRACVGIGEAGYGAVAPTLIADVTEPGERSRKLAWFYLAIPVGSALGYLFGGYVGEYYGWRSAFVFAGLPGLLLAILALRLNEPQRGAKDLEHVGASLGVRATWANLRANAAWRSITVGMTLMVFSMGGLAFWMPTYLVRVHGMSLATASTGFGAVTVVTGLIGTLVGGYLGDRAAARDRGGYLRISGIGLVMGAPFCLAIPFLQQPVAVFAAVFVAELCMFLNTGPLNAALLASVGAHVRGSAVAINVFFIHALGDAISPPLLGRLSESHGLDVAVGATALPTLLGGIVLWWAGSVRSATD